MIDDEWLRALGRSVFYFSFVETAVVSIINSLVPTTPSYFEQALDTKRTAGGVQRDFKDCVDGLPDGPMRLEFEQLAERFRVAVGRRNDLLHAIPASFGDYTHLVRLTRDKFIAWSLEEISDAAAEFEKLADDLNMAQHQLHHRPDQMTIRTRFDRNNSL
jgi:hypothetical protein